MREELQLRGSSSVSDLHSCHDPCGRRSALFLRLTVRRGLLLLASLFSVSLYCGGIFSSGTVLARQPDPPSLAAGSGVKGETVLVPSQLARAELDTALRGLKMGWGDVHFRSDYADPEPFRLTLIDDLLDSPLDAGERSYEIGGAFSWQEESTIEELVLTAVGLLDIEVGREVEPRERGEGRMRLPRVLPAAFQRALARLAAAMGTASGEVEAAFAPLSADEMAFLIAQAPRILEEEAAPDEEKTPEEEHAEWEREEANVKELLRVAGLIDRRRLYRGSVLLARAVDQFRAALDEPGVLPSPPPGQSRHGASGDDGVQGDLLAVCETPVGPIAIGGPGRTLYRGEFALIVDLGGNDLYENRAAGARLPDFPVAVIVDLAGDDTYLSDQPGAQGSAFLGIGILVDEAGDDSYRSKNYSQGAGLFGTGVLLDLSGHDSYSCDTAGEGAGTFGIGLLVDGDGGDEYSAAIFSQGFGYVHGIGVISEAGGNDTYTVGGVYLDELRYFDHYLSLSQGFGFGMRPWASGGVGFIVEDGGNDTYVSDIFGQGSSYWFALGSIVDREGNDSYLSYQYAQGAGTHITIGTLLDLSGDDNYVSHGVSQGCGHDLALGLLWDREGDDNYATESLSQGAGNANGVGILIDETGEDNYLIRRYANTQAYGDFRREYGSIGLLLDLGGSDHYSGRGGEDRYWTSSSYGLGIDRAPLPDVEEEAGPAGEEEGARAAADEAGEEAVEEAGAEEGAVLTGEELRAEVKRLFIRAGSGALKYAALRDSAKAALIEMGGEAAPYLADELGTENARERHVVEDLFTQIGEPGVPALIARLTATPRDLEETRAVQLAVRILGELGDGRAVEPVAGLAGAETWQTRSAVCRALGKLGEVSVLPILVDALEDEVEIVRKSAAVALGELGDETAVPALVDALADPFYSVRYPAMNALAAIGEPAVESLLEAARSGEEAGRSYALEALGEIGDARAVDALIAALTDPDWSVRASAARALGSFDSRRARDALEALGREEAHPLVLARIGEALEGGE